MATTLAVAASVLVAGAGPAVAHPACGAFITADLVLDADLVCPDTAIVIGANDVTIDLHGFSLVGSGSGSGVLANGWRGLRVLDGTIRGFSNGIFLNRHVGGGFSRLTLQANTFGVRAIGGSGNRVERSSVTGSQVGIVGQNLEVGMVVSGNRLTGNGGGMAFVSNSGGHQVVDNTISGNSGGGISVTESGGIHIRANRILGNGRVGVAFFIGGGHQVLDNTISDHGGSGVGISGPFSSNIEIRGNRLVGNEVGVKVGGANGSVSASGTVVEGNEFMRNGAAGLLVVVNENSTVAGSRYTGNIFSRNGLTPGETTGLSGDVVNDGLHLGMVPGATAPTVTANRADRNADYGIQAAGVTDGGGNNAGFNGNAAQCLGVVCKRL